MSTVYALALNVGLTVAVLAPAYVRHVVLPWRRERAERAS